MIKASLSMFRENVNMSVTNVLHNKLRSFLTILGIIIGVAAVIAMITTVSGVTGEITSQFSALGADKFNVTVTGTRLKGGLTTQEVELLSGLDNISAVSLSVSSTVAAKNGSEWSEKVNMEGRNTVYFQKNEELIERGRPLTILDEEQKTRVCLISSDLQKKLFYGEDAVGQMLYLGGHSFTVVGILSTSTRDVMAQALGMGPNEKVIVPYTTAMRLNNTAYIRSLEVFVEDISRMEETIDSFEQELKAVFNGHDDTYSVINMASLMDTLDTITGMMSTMLAGIAGISLLVGGIGIMNMMLVSVTERTTEIGLRKALGAEPGQIQLQFLIEAFILSLMGGVLGAVTGVLLSMLLSSLINTTFVINWGAIALGVSFSAVVGLVFGWAPARKASRLNPIDALRAA